MLMKSVGQILKETREGKGKSLKEVANSTKIRETLLQALEEGDYSSFYSEVHLKSFLRSYANFLDINEEKIMAIYRREKEVGNVKSEHKTFFSKPFNSSANIILSKFINIKGLLSILILIGIGLILLFFYKQWQAFNIPPTLEVLTPAENAIVSSDTVTIEGFTGDPSVKVVLDGNDATYTDVSGKFKVTGKFSEPGTRKFHLIATNQFNKTMQKDIDLKYVPQIIPQVTPKIRITNTSNTPYTISSSIDNLVQTSQTIPQKGTIELNFANSLNISNFNNTILSLYINNNTDPSPINSKNLAIRTQTDGSVIITDVTVSITATLTPTQQDGKKR